MKSLLAIALAVSATIPLRSLAQSQPTSLGDDRFIRQALASGTKEIAEADIYAGSQDPRVSLFANRIVKDHATANTALIALAKSLRVTIPNGVLPASALEHPSPQPQAMTPQQRSAKMQGPTKYFASEVKAHEKAIALFQYELRHGSNPRVKSFARETIPVLEAHLALARKDLAAERGGGH